MLKDLVFQLRRHLFVRVYHKNPIFGRLGMGEGFLVSISCPFALDDNIRELPADLYRTVGTERIYYDDLIAPSQAAQTTANIIFLVIANDDCRNARFRCGVGLSVIHGFTRQGDRAESRHKSRRSKILNKLIIIALGL